MNDLRKKEAGKGGRKGLIVLAIVALIAIGFWLWWKAPNSSVKKEVQHLKPELIVASLNITDIDQNKLRATSKIILKNNLPIEVKTERLNYAIFIDSAKIIESTYSKPITIRSSDTTAITLPLEILFKKLTAVLKRFDEKKIDSADYSVRAAFQVDVPIARERNFTMHFTRRLPAFKLLKTTMGAINLDKFGLKESSLEITLNVENPNAFPMKMKDGKYSLSIDNDKNVMDGVVQKIVDIPAHASAPVLMHVDMKTLKIPKLGWKMLFDKKDTRFKLNFSSKLVSDNGMLNNSKMAFNMSGTLDELQNLKGTK